MMKLRKTLFSVAGVLSLSLTVSACVTPRASTTADASTSPAPEGTASSQSDEAARKAASASDPRLSPNIEIEYLKQGIATLASDEFQGRYTLSPSLQKAAEWLVTQYQSYNIQALGTSYLHPYTIRDRVELEGEPGLQLLRGNKTQSIAASDFQAVPLGGSGTVQGEVVFVGYGLQLDATQARHAIDELAGVDIKGKIALLFADSPGSIDYDTIFARLDEQAKSFAQAAEKLPDGDTKGLRKLHEQARTDIAMMVRPYLKQSEIPDAFWSIPETPTKELEERRLFGHLWEPLRTATQRHGIHTRVRTQTKLEALKAKGAAGVIEVRGPNSFLDAQAKRDESFGPLEEETRGSWPSPLGIPMVQLSYDDADRWVRGSGVQLATLQKKIDKDLKPQSRPLPGLKAGISVKLKFHEVSVPNVVATIPGTDLKDEIIVVGAHYDHIGTDELGHCSRIEKPNAKVDKICNGADDNASGTAAILEIARATAAMSEKPRRTLVFVHFSGEEMGLLGSRAFAANPPIDLDNVKAMINIDMIGRNGANGVQIGGIATSSLWMPLLDDIGTGGLATLYEASSTSRSDHAAFYDHHIPVLFYFTGVHEDYHRAGDEAQKINYQDYHTITKLAGEVVHRLGRGYPITWTEPAPGQGRVSHLPGDSDDTVIKRVPAAATPTATQSF